MTENTTLIRLPIYLSDDFVVRFGVNEGDPVGRTSTLMLDDLYRLQSSADQHHLSLTTDDNNGLAVDQNSAIGRAGDAITIEGLLTFMGPGAQVVEALTLVLAKVSKVVVLPLDALDADVDYRLIGIDQDSGVQALARFATVSFARGTRITMACGQQRAIEDLAVGDQVLTRDHGPQTVRWTGHQTQRASEACAPIRVAAGTLNNANDLYLSPDHRLLLFERLGETSGEPGEAIVKAKELINGQSVSQIEGGFVDFHQILFDRHHMVFAEGIAAEATFASCLTREIATSGRAPYELARQDVSDMALVERNREAAADLLRRAATLG
ncbi:MAG: Hint domain-containing protein [Roseobacter sp.]